MKNAEGKGDWSLLYVSTSKIQYSVNNVLTSNDTVLTLKPILIKFWADLIFYNMVCIPMGKLTCQF